MMLLVEGVESNTPRAVLKEAYHAQLLMDGDGWIDMLEDRNKTSHLYDEAAAAAIYQKIKKGHFQRLRDLRLVAEKIVSSV